MRWLQNTGASHLREINAAFKIASPRPALAGGEQLDTHVNMAVKMVVKSCAGNLKARSDNCYIS